MKLIKEEVPIARTAIIGNKQDLEGAMEPAEIEESLGLITFPMSAINPDNKDNMVKIIADILGKGFEIKSLLDSLSKKEELKDELISILKSQDFDKAEQIFDQLKKLCQEIGDESFLDDILKNEQELKKNLKELGVLKYFQASDVKQIQKPAKLDLSLIENRLKTLLRNFINEVPGVDGISISDREGLILASEIRGGIEDEMVMGAISAIMDGSMERIKREFGTKSNFFVITSTADKKFAFCSLGAKSILTTVADPSTSDIELRVYSEHVAGKIELLLDREENVSLEIPEIIKVLSKTKSGKIPAGKFTTKLIITGDFKVGKSSLIKRFVENRFKESYQSTIGVELSQKILKINDETTIDFILWDIGGQMTQMAPYRARFYNGALAAFIVLDRSRPKTFEDIKLWYNDIKKSVQVEIPIVIVGNKSDLENLLVSELEIKKLAQEFGFHYILTSAKTGENVNDAFLYIAYKFLETL